MAEKELRICFVFLPKKMWTFGHHHHHEPPILQSDEPGKDSPTTAKNSGLRPKMRTNHLSFGTI